MDSQDTLVLLFGFMMLGIAFWWALNNKPSPRREMSLEAQRAYERKRGELLAEQNYNESQLRQQQFQQKKREVARGLNRRNGSLF